jgi:16S rRNA (uracil1498-N3)-methyltransferase
MVLFAPIKVGRLEYMVQKMTEMGAGIIQPVFTDHTQLHKVNEKRLEANIVEAAEQCGVLSIPELRTPQKLLNILTQWDDERHLVFCDEGHETNNPIPTLQELASKEIAVLVGPEGGFSEKERTILNEMDHVSSIPLGPRILRADTAMVSAISIIQATIGDWN